MEFLNEMIQWLTQDWLVSLLDESVFMNEWFNDSLKIDSFHYWTNQCLWMNDSMTHSRLTRFITGRISVYEWMIQWLTQDWLVSLLDESVFMNECSVTHSRLTRFITGRFSVYEWMIQWLTQDWLISLLDESVFMNEWFNDSLKIDSFHYWTNQCLWMNDSMTHSRLTRFITGRISVYEWMIQWLTQDWLVSLLDESVFMNEWFNDSLKIDSFHYWTNQCLWMNDSMTHSRLTHFITGRISVYEWMIQWLTQDWLVSLLDKSVFMNEWFNDSLTIDSFHYWTNQCLWMNDSVTHSRLNCFITGRISVYEWMIQWLTQDWLVSLLDESVFMNEWFNDSLKIDSFHYWTNQCLWMNDSMTHSRLTHFITGRISVYEWMIQWLTQDWLISLLDESVFMNEWFNDSLTIDSFHYWTNHCLWMNDSVTHSRLTRFITGRISVYESMIQWLTQDWLVSLLNESVFMNEWFNDSLKIDSFHYWTNQCLWMNDWMTHTRLTRFITGRISVYEWNDSMTHTRLTRFITGQIRVFEWNDSMTHSRLTRFITGRISVYEWMIQWLTQDWLVSLLDESVFMNEWFNDSLKIDSFHYWTNQCLWINDSVTHKRLTRFITGRISVHEWMIQWLTQDWLVSLLDESVFMNEWFNDSLKIDSFHYWTNQCLWMNDSMTHSRLTRFITGRISVYEWMIQWGSWTDESPIREIFNSHLRRRFDRIPRESGDIESKLTMFSTCIVDAAARSCGRKVYGACRGWQSPNTVVDTGSKGWELAPPSPRPWCSVGKRGLAHFRLVESSCRKWRSLSILGSCSRVREGWNGRLTNGSVQLLQ